MTDWDAVVVGAGPAGLAAALTLARARRRTLVLDTDRGRNRTASHSHGVLGFDGTPPGAMLERGREDAARYGAVLRAGEATGATATEEGFALTVDGVEVATRSVLVASGVTDVLPEVPGVEALWGTGVVVCPYCDGWEHRDRRIAILGTGDRSVGQALLLRQWSADVVLLANGAVRPSEGEREALAARGIPVVEGRVERVAAADGGVTAVVDGRDEPFAIVFTAPLARPNDAVLVALGAERLDAAAGGFVRVTEEGATSVPGVWAAGNVTRPSLKVQSAAGAGMAAGADANEWLMRQDVLAALRRSAPGATRG